jgi:hypothetical protein
MRVLLIGLLLFAASVRADDIPQGKILQKFESSWIRLKVGKEYVDFAPQFFFVIQAEYYEALDEKDEGLRVIPVTFDEWYQFDEGDFFYDPSQG